jgi:cholesterol transport system auxiliary component
VRIAVRNRDQSYGVLTGARWSLPAPRLVQAVLVEAFERSGRVPGVGPASMLRGHCALNGELREFHWAPDSQQATLTLAVRLQCGPSGSVQAMRTFEASRPVEGRGAAAVVSAFDAALAELTPQLVEWTLANGPSGPR